jgi:hypothetical protein
MAFPLEKTRMYTDSPLAGEDQPRWVGIDYLRASMSLFVLAWHIRLFGMSSLFSPTEYPRHRMELSDLINFNILLLAVPVFFLVSLFLQVEKWKATQGRIWGRIEHLTYLYLFWTTVSLAVYKMEGYLYLVWPDSILSAFLFVLSGGRSLFYFIFSLILLTAAGYASRRWPLRWKQILALGCLALLWMFPWIVLEDKRFHLLVALWNPLNFLVYVFIAHLLSHYFGNHPEMIRTSGYWKAVLCLGILFVLTASWEWFWIRGIDNFTYDGYAFTSYTRVSIALGATILVLISFSITRPPGFVVKWLSNYSLGIYCLHGFVTYYYFRVKPAAVTFPGRLGDFLVILTGSLCLAFVLRRAFRKGLL